MVYVARGSHASYFEPGRHWTGHWFDYADGKRKSPDLSLKSSSRTTCDWRWIRWPGCWGDTKKGDNPLDSESPRGPGDHKQWDDPLVMVKKADTRPVPPDDRPLPPASPRVRVEWAGSTIRVHYSVLPGSDRRIPRGLAVTINSPEETAPPTTETFTIATRTGSVDVKTTVDPTKPYDIYVSCATAAGLASQSVRSTSTPPSAPSRAPTAVCTAPPAGRNATFTVTFAARRSFTLTRTGRRRTRRSSPGPSPPCAARRPPSPSPCRGRPPAP